MEWIEELTAGPNAGTSPERALRQRLLERFESWLDDLLGEGHPPIGIAADLLAELEAENDPEAAFDTEGGDLYSLWSAVIALTQEVKLQGRAFQRLTTEVTTATTEEDGRLEEQRARATGELERRLSRQAAETLLDLHERLARGLTTAQAHLDTAGVKRPWLLAIRGPHRDAWNELLAATAALERGYTLALERLDEELTRLGLEPLEALGRGFDPHTMTAVDVEPGRPDLADGTVSEVLRLGYTWRGEVLRLSEVKVKRAWRRKKP